MPIPDEMLFDIEADPHEQHNIAEQNRPALLEASYRLAHWHDEMMQAMHYDVDSLWTVMREGGPFHAKGHLPRYCEWLEQTGRSQAVAELRRRHPHEFA